VQAAEFGRAPESIKIVAGVLVIVAETDEQAREKYELLASYGDREGALSLFGGWSGYDLSKYGDDDDFRFLESAPTAIRSMVNHWARESPQGTKWTKKVIAEHLILGGNGPKIIGSPTTVADELEKWVEVADIDGFNLSYASIPETLDDIIEHLIPELRRRGIFWDDYAVPGGTLRENYLGVKGATRLSDTHPGAKYFWKAGEDEPRYIKLQGEGEVTSSDSADAAQ